MREFIGGRLNIDGRMIKYNIVTARDYLIAKGYTPKEADKIRETHPIGELLTQILGLKHACFLLRRTSHSCESLPDQLYNLKLRLILELHEKYNFDFDDNFVENFKFKKVGS